MALVLVDNTSLDFTISIKSISQFLLRGPMDVSTTLEVWYEVDLRDTTNEESSAEY